MKKHPIILDVDTGFDDAFAVLFAAMNPEVDLLGITCVDGNTNVHQVVKNTLIVLDAAGAGEIPVAPLTNIANFITAYPDTAKKLKEICLMGGSASVGNATAMAEFNIWHDPEAADIVFKSGIPITMYGLDVFYHPLVTEAEAVRLSESAQASAQFAGKLLQSSIKRLKQSVTLGDYGAVAAVIRPSLIKCETFDVGVEVAPGLVRGMTVVDRRPRLELMIEPRRIPGAARTRVVLDLDAEGFRQLWFKTVDSSWS